MPSEPRVLVVTAVDAERDAVLHALGAAPAARVVSCGAGPVAAAAGTATLLAGSTYDLVLCAGIAGGFAPLGPGGVAVASTIAFADLGSDDADGSFLPISTLGFGTDSYAVAPTLAVELADRTGGHLGTVVTVATVTGTAARADELSGRFPDAVAEGMEGAGVAHAAQAAGVPFAELRTISNLVGPRDRGAWQIPLALTTLGRAVKEALA